jgi:hypothetical protein
MVKKKQKQSVLESYNQHTKKNNDGDDQLLAVMHHVCTCESGPGLGMCPRFSKENSLAPAPHAPPFDTQGTRQIATFLEYKQTLPPVRNIKGCSFSTTYQGLFFAKHFQGSQIQ